MIYSSSYFSFPSSWDVGSQGEDRQFRSRMARAIRLATTGRRALRIRQRIEVILQQLESHWFGYSELEEVEKKIGVIRRYLESDEPGAAIYELRSLAAMLVSGIEG